MHTVNFIRISKRFQNIRTPEINWRKLENCFREYRSSHRRKWCSEKFRKFYKKTPVLESLFNEAEKIDSNIGFSCEICKIFKNIYFEEHLTAPSENKVVEWHCRAVLKYPSLKGHCFCFIHDYLRLYIIQNLWESNTTQQKLTSLMYFHPGSFWRKLNCF